MNSQDESKIQMMPFYLFKANLNILICVNSIKRLQSHTQKKMANGKISKSTNTYTPMIYILHLNDIYLSTKCLANRLSINIAVAITFTHGLHTQFVRLKCFIYVLHPFCSSRATKITILLVVFEIARGLNHHFV